MSSVGTREHSNITLARLGGGGGLNQNADTADALEGGGGLSQNDDMLTLCREVGERGNLEQVLQ